MNDDFYKRERKWHIARPGYFSRRSSYAYKIKTRFMKEEEYKDYYDSQYDEDSEPEFSKLVKNKRVILVGPAPYLKGKGLGKQIDSYDVVVKMNRSFDIDEKFD